MARVLSLACLSVALLSACAAVPERKSVSDSSSYSATGSNAPSLISDLQKIDDLNVLETYASKYPRERTLVVFDIDDTLLTTPTESGGGRKFFGSDRWYVWQYYGLPKDSEHKIGNCLFEVISTNAKSAAQDETQVDAIEILMRMPNDKLMLTSRGPDMSSATYTQLKSAGYAGIPSLLPNTPVEIQVDGVSALYDNGVFLTKGAHKGRALIALLKAAQREYDYVILVDDTEKNVLNMAVSMALERINYVGLRYNRIKNDPPVEVTPAQVEAHKRDWQELRTSHADLVPRWDAGECPKA